MKHSTTSVLALAAMGSSLTCADIYWLNPSSTADVIISEPVPDEFVVTIRSLVNGSALVVLSTDETDDMIQSITILDGPGNNFDNVNLSIRDASGLFRAPISAIESIDDFSTNGTDLIQCFITGDLGSTTNSTPLDIDVRSIEQINIGGSLLGSIWATDNSATAKDAEIKIDGDIVDSEILVEIGDIAFARIDGDVTGTSNIWADGTIGELTVLGNYSGTIGSGPGSKSNSDINIITIDGN